MAAETPSIGTTARRLWVLYALAAAAFLPAIGFQYVGEEAMSPRSSVKATA